MRLNSANERYIRPRCICANAPCIVTNVTKYLRSNYHLPVEFLKKAVERKDSLLTYNILFSSCLQQLWDVSALAQPVCQIILTACFESSYPYPRFAIDSGASTSSSTEEKTGSKGGVGESLCTSLGLHLIPYKTSHHSKGLHPV